MKIYLNSYSNVQNNYANVKKNIRTGVPLYKSTEYPNDSFSYTGKNKGAVSFGATFFRTVMGQAAAGAAAGGVIGSKVGVSIDLGTGGTTLGLGTLTGSGAGAIIGGLGGLGSGIVTYFVDKSHEKKQRKQAKENADLQERLARIEKKNKADSQQRNEIDEKNDKEIEKLQGTLEKSKNTINILQTYDTKNSTEIKSLGLDKIAGYEKDKEILHQIFITPFINSVSGEGGKDNHNTAIPNGVLLYGLSGNGKTTLAQGIIEYLEKKTDCNVYDLSEIPHSKLQKKLTEIKEEAAKNLKENNIRTIVFMDEFDGFAPKQRTNKLLNDKNTENNSNDFLKKFMDDCALYGITIVATTNYPQKIDKSFIINTGRFSVRTLIEPPSAIDKKQILEYYLDGLTTNNINYYEIVKILENNEKAKNGLYSCSRIEFLAKQAKAFARKEKRLVTQNDIIKHAQEIKPDLEEDDINKFKEDFEYTTGMTYEEYIDLQNRTRNEE